MSANIPPHGGTLVDRRVPVEQRADGIARAKSLPAIHLDAKAESDMELIATGAVSPLHGFMTQSQYQSVVNSMHLPNGLPWTVPVTLAVDNGTAESLTINGSAALMGQAGDILGTIRVQEKFKYAKEVEASGVYRTTDALHPGVAALYAQGDTLVGGEIDVFDLPPHDEFAHYYLTPSETRSAFADRNWSTIVGFQTRNPVHRAHEYIQKCALEITDGLLLHPLVGKTKSDDVPADVRMRCYEALLADYYPAERTLLSVNPAAMRYAGPREAVFHAIIRKNYGCTHFIVGRDHAGVGAYYGTYDAQKIFAEFDPAGIGIVPLNFEHTFYCRKCEGMASAKTCPHSADHRVTLSGTRVRDMLKAGEIPPIEFTRPEVARILIQSMQAD